MRLSKHLRGCLEVDDEIRRRNALGQEAEELLVDEQLRILEVQIGEEPALLEDVVRHRELGEELSLDELLLLAVAREQEEQLGLERRSTMTVVEGLEERVVRPLLEHRIRVEPLRQLLDERRLADADRTLDRDVVKLHAGAPAALTGRTTEVVSAPCKKLGHREPQRRMDDRGGDLGEGNQNEPAQVEAWVWNRQIRAMARSRLAEQQHVEVDDARSVRRRSVPAPWRAPTSRHASSSPCGVRVGVASENTVEEPALRRPPHRLASRRDELPRDRVKPEAATRRSRRLGDGALAIAEIRAHSHEHPLLDPLSFERRG